MTGSRQSRCMWIGAAAGFVASAAVLRWAYLLPTSVGAALERLAMLPAGPVLLVFKQGGSEIAGWTDLLVISELMSAIVGALFGLAWCRYARSKSERRPERKRRSIVLRVLLGGAAAFIAFCIIMFLWDTVAEKPGLAGISERTGLKFPPGTSLTHTDFEWGFIFTSSKLFARIEINRRDVERFLDSQRGQKTVCRGKDRSAITYDLASDRQPLSWWNPDSVHKSVYAQAGTAYLLIGLDDPRRAVVYVTQ